MLIENLLLKKSHLLSPGQLRVMKYIINNYNESIFLTASRLAQKANVSEATVVRLAQNLGFAGYPSLQRKLREDLQERLSTVSRLKQVVGNTTNEGDVLMKVLQEDIQNLSNTLQDISIKTFQQGIEEIEAAKRIFVAGFRGAHAPALTLAIYLRFFKEQVHLLAPGYGDVWDVICGINSDDLLIAISVPRYTRLTLEIAEHARNQGSRVGAITDSLVSPLAQYAHWVLPVHSRLNSFIESLTATMSLVNAILTAISVKVPEETLKVLKDREVIWKAKRIYVESYPFTQKINALKQ